MRALDPDAVIPWLASAFRRGVGKNVLAGVADDDCGVIQLGKTIAVLSVDFLNATPIAEQLGLGGDRTLGRLAVAATLADLYGSGATPRALLIAVTLPHGYPEHRFRALMSGARLEASRWRVPVIGGDTKLGRARALLTCGLGTAESRNGLFLTRKARAGDAIFASGDLGTCAAATFLISSLPRGGHVPRWAREAITIPALPAARSRALSRLEVVHGGIDISDGLAADLRHMCDVSGVGAVLQADSIPVSPRVVKLGTAVNVPPWAFSLTSGGDFQFIVTVPPRAWAAVARLGFAKIGMITRGLDLLIERKGSRPTALPKVGHRDRRGQKFGAEIRSILQGVKRGAN
jgi:thiamine-monophosphate kinase